MRPDRPAALALALAVPLLAAQAPPPDRPPGDARFGQYRIEFPHQALRWPSFRIVTAETRGGEMRFRLTAELLFDFDRAELRPQAEGMLRDLVRQLRERPPGTTILVEGHTDSIGGDTHNDALSVRRAQAVRAWLIGPGALPAALVRAEGFGRHRPVAPNAHPDGSDDPLGRQQNRRVEVVALARR